MYSEKERVETQLNALTIDCRKYEVGVPESLKAALKHWNRDFVVWKSTDYDRRACLDERFSPSNLLSLSAGQGDFNGDSKVDFVLAGHDKKNEFIVVALSTNAADFEIIPLCESPGSGTNRVTDCGLLYGKTLSSLPQIAIYRILPKGTIVNASTGEASGGDDFRLNTAAFIAAVVDQDYGRRKNDIIVRGSPFSALLLFRWDFRLVRKWQRRIEQNTERYSGIEFVTYSVGAVQLPGKERERLPADTDGY